MADGLTHALGLRLLWADESADQAQRVRALLADAFELHVAHQAEAALQLARERAPDVVCAVGALHTRDGVPLLRALRALPELRDTTFLFSCPRGQENTYPDELLACADDLLLTPFSSCELTIRLRFHARRARAHKEGTIHDEFLSSLGHELRTPLTAIQLWTESLRGANVSEQQLTQALRAIGASAQIQSRRIDDLLDMARLSLGTLTLERRSALVSTLLREASDELSPLATSKGVSLQVELSEPTGSVNVDARRLRQVLSHLLSNAIRFTPEGGRVTLRARRRGEGVELEVSDTGEGMDQRAQARLFERCERSQPQDARGAGLSMGLSLSRKLVELHGGTIEAHSGGPGCGTSFRILLPCSCSAAAGSARSDKLASARLDGRTVLVVEDHEETRAAMQFVLERAGARVLAAEDGQSALARFGVGEGPSSSVDLVVCDLSLPDMSGYEFMERVVEAHRSRGSSPPPSCAVSAHTREADRQRAIRAGFDLHLAKPLSADALVDALEDLSQVLVAHDHPTISQGRL